jgi:hypothetical protein
MKERYSARVVEIGWNARTILRRSVTHRSEENTFDQLTRAESASGGSSSNAHRVKPMSPGKPPYEGGATFREYTGRHTTPGSGDAMSHVELTENDRG